MLRTPDRGCTEKAGRRASEGGTVKSCGGDAESRRFRMQIHEIVPPDAIEAKPIIIAPGTGVASNCFSSHV